MLTIQADSIPAYQLKSSIEDPGTVKVIRDKPFFKANPSALAFFAVPKQIDGLLLTAALQLNAWMPNEKTLLYQNKRGLGWKDARGWDVFVGQKLEDINDKMVMYETVVRELEKQGVDVEIIDPRTLKPLDIDTVIKSVKKTGRLVGLTEAYENTSFINEVMAQVNELAFDWLDAPMVRVAALNVPVPRAEVLEDMAIPNVNRVLAACRKVIS